MQAGPLLPDIEKQTMELLFGDTVFRDWESLHRKMCGYADVIIDVYTESFVEFFDKTKWREKISATGEIAELWPG